MALLHAMEDGYSLRSVRAAEFHVRRRKVIQTKSRALLTRE